MSAGRGQRPRVPPALRTQVLRRSAQKAVAAGLPAGYSLCEVCNAGIAPGEAIEVDHITPVTVGGANVLGNCRAAHPRCNKLAWRRYLEWSDAVRRQDDALAPCYLVDTTWWTVTACCDVDGRIRAMVPIAGRQSPTGVVGTLLRELVAMHRAKRLPIRVTPLAGAKPLEEVA